METESRLGVAKGLGIGEWGVKCLMDTEFQLEMKMLWRWVVMDAQQSECI